MLKLKIYKINYFRCPLLNSGSEYGQISPKKVHSFKKGEEN